MNSFIASIVLVSLISSNLVRTSGSDNPNGPVVQTLSGAVVGRIVQGSTNQDTAVFYGIPYAETPTGTNRFLPPKPVKPWSTVLQATELPRSCYQFYTTNEMKYSRESKRLIRRPWSEDCLTLNIWVPVPTPTEDPVLVFLHSGEFSTGSATYPIYQDGGSTLAAVANSVVVTVNYRLGPFGFLSLGVPEVPGNVGLLDQQLAMKWIKENIHFFGGKKEAILLVGEGDAGSASVGYHLMSESSADLFKTVTVLDGSVLCPYAFLPKEKSLDLGQQLSRKLGCDTSNLTEELHCLRHAHPEDVVDAEHSIQNGSWPGFKPTVDGSFITESPVEAMKSGRFSKVSVLSIINAAEGSLRLKIANPDVMSDPERGITMEGFRKSFARVAPDLRQSTLASVEEMYVDDCSRGDPARLRDAAIRLYSDVWNDCCLNLYMDYLVLHGSPVFFNVNDLDRASDASWVGASHEMVIMYILGYPMAQEKYGFDKVQAEVSTLFTDWINENARKRLGDPTSFQLRYDLEDRHYVYWKFLPHNRTNYRKEACAIWNEVLPEMVKRERPDCH